MPRRPRPPGANSSSFAFRHAYRELDDALQRYAEWLRGPFGPKLAASTAASYPSTLRTVLTRVLVNRMTPSEAIRTVGAAPLGAAMRSFLAFTLNGGEVLLDGKPFRFGRCDAGFPAGLRDRLRPRVSTEMGNLLEAAGLVACVRAVWFDLTPNRLAEVMLRNVLTRDSSDLYRLAPATMVVAQEVRGRALVRMALFSHAGSEPDPFSAPLLTAGQYDPNRGTPAAPPHALWDLAGREVPAGHTIELPPEGEALLAGEAIDLSGVAPLCPDLAAEDFRHAYGPRHAAPASATAEEEVQAVMFLTRLYKETRVPRESLMTRLGAAGVAAADAGVGTLVEVAEWDVNGSPASYRPVGLVQSAPGWRMTANVAGVPALGEGPEAVPGDLDPSATSPEPQEMLTDREQPEAPPELLEEVFDAPALPG